MNMWIDEYREANGLELDEFARRVNIVGRKMNPPLWGTVTDTLIYKLERSKTPRTHPRIANAIATVCGATSEQRDSIVDERHRGKWEPVASPFEWREQKETIPRNQGFKLDKAVVQVDGKARIINRWGSIRQAAKYTNVSAETIVRHCGRRVHQVFTVVRPYTYRFAEEWDKMSMAEKLQDLGVEINE